MKKKERETTTETGIRLAKAFDPSSWKPITELGRKVKAKEITDLGEILNQGKRILELEIVEMLLPELESDLLAVGQSKGKFGGGKRTIWRQTQKKTQEGNKPTFGATAIVGNRDGYIGLGSGRSKETVPSREKAVRNAKLNIIKIRRGCGSWACGCGSPHTIPFTVEGKCGSVIVKLMPAPKGTNLVVQNELKKMLAFAGIKDVYSKSYGHSNTRLNLIRACFQALKKLSQMKVQPAYVKKAGMTEGRNE
ncbi:MAG: 30S ribosomal protein S5 [Candidatus Woesearchaeota archaeon]